jgi:mannose-1-phosphate guanylyltransferase
MKAMLLAAGEGTRFRPHTLKVPKPALPLLNVPLGYYFFPFLKSAGVDSLIVNTFHLPQLVEKLYRSQNQFKVDFTFEVGKILGNGGGLGNARQYFAGEENFFLLNADEVLIPQNQNFLKEMTAQHLKNKPLSTLLIMRHPDVGTKFGGIWVDKNKTVVGFGKVRPANAVEGFHYPGIQILNKEIFNFIKPGVEQNILYDNVLAGMQAGHKVELFEVSGHWYETGNLIDYLHTTRDLLQNLAHQEKDFEILKKFLTEFAPQSHLEKIGNALVWKDSRAKIENSAFIDFAVLSENTQLKNAKVEASVLNAATLLDSITISKEFVL